MIRVKRYWYIGLVLIGAFLIWFCWPAHDAGNEGVSTQAEMVIEVPLATNSDGRVTFRGRLCITFANRSKEPVTLLSIGDQNEFAQSPRSLKILTPVSMSVVSDWKETMTNNFPMTLGSGTSTTLCQQAGGLVDRRVPHELRFPLVTTLGSNQLKVPVRTR